MNVRLAGLLKLVGSGVLYAVVFATVLEGGRGEVAMGPHTAMFIALPGAIALAGLVELVTGFPFQRLSVAWAHLAVWQRGVLGILSVIAGFALVALGMVTFA